MFVTTFGKVSTHLRPLSMLMILTFSLPKAHAVMGTYLPKESAPSSACMVVYVDSQKKIKGLCSGDIAGADKFLTAGHCQLGNQYAQLVICDNQKNTPYVVNAVRIHPSFDGNGNQFDQAILQVENPFSLPAINLPSNQDEITSLLNKKDCEFWAYGFDNDRKAGKLNGVTAEFNGAIFGEGLIGVGGKNWPIQGDSGGGLYCKSQNGQLIRVGTVSRAEIGLSSVASLSGALDWIKDNLKQTFPKGENSGPSAQPQAKAESRSRQGQVDGESYDDCVVRLNFATRSDNSGYLKQHLSELIARQCHQTFSNSGERKARRSTRPTVDADPIVGIKEVSYYVFKSDVTTSTDICARIEHNSSKIFEIMRKSGGSSKLELARAGAICGPSGLIGMENGCHEISLSNGKLFCKLGATVRELDKDGYPADLDPEALRLVPEDSQALKLQKTLASFALDSCRIRGGLRSDVAMQVAQCFVQTDFWTADRQYSGLAGGENIAGTGTGLAMACTRAKGIECSRNFMRAGVHLSMPDRIRLIEDDGKYQFQGYGAGASTVFIAPGVRASIQVNGHSQVFYSNRKNLVACSSNFSGCTSMGAGERD